MEVSQLEKWSKSLKKREIEKEVLAYLFKPFVVVILGSRQVGKTSLLRKLMTDLVFEKKIAPSQILYFDFEIIADVSTFSSITPESIKRVVSAYGANPQKQTFLFIDEIQYHPNPSNLLKVIFDHLPTIKLAVSGSSTLKIRTKFKDSLAGRHKTFVLPGLTFEEFLDFKNLELMKRNVDKEELPLGVKDNLKSLFEEYVVFGGYPKVAMSETQEEKISVLESIFTSYVRRDIKDLAIIEETEKFNRLVSLLAFQIGNLVNLSELSSASGLNRRTLEKYLFLLENTFIISLFKPFFTNKRKELVKSQKIYFQDTGLRNYVTNNFSPLEKRPDNGSLFENAVFNLLSKNQKGTDRLRFWRTILKNEVDFIRLGEDNMPFPYECKLGVLGKPKIPGGLLSFVRSYHPKEARVINLDRFAKISFEKTKIYFLPGWKV